MVLEHAFDSSLNSALDVGTIIGTFGLSSLLQLTQELVENSRVNTGAERLARDDLYGWSSVRDVIR